MNTRVNIILKKNQVALVEYRTDKLKRVSVPVSVIQNGMVDLDILEMGIPYGENWTNLITLSATSLDLENELHEMGIWTAQQVIENPNRVLNALMAVYQIELSTILRIAKGVVKNG